MRKATAAAASGEVTLYCTYSADSESNRKSSLCQQQALRLPFQITPRCSITD